MIPKEFNGEFETYFGIRNSFGMWHLAFGISGIAEDVTCVSCGIVKIRATQLVRVSGAV